MFVVMPESCLRPHRQVAHIAVIGFVDYRPDELALFPHGEVLHLAVAFTEDEPTRQ